MPLEGIQGVAAAATDVPVVVALRGGGQLPVVNMEGAAVVAAECPLDVGLVAATRVGRAEQGDQGGVVGAAVTLQAAGWAVGVAGNSQRVEIGSDHWMDD